VSSTEKLITVSQASSMLGVSKWTLRRYPREILEPLRTPKGHRRYRLSDVEKLQGVSTLENNNVVAIYCRVSSQDQKQKGDLERQKGRVLEHCIKKKYLVEYILEEVGSGLNDNRKKFHKLLELVSAKKITKVVVEHKDRLTRFNFEILKILFKGFNVDVEVVQVELNKTFEEELVSDMVSLMSSFSARLYGKRSSKNKKINENK
jgi:predicted site-specific integrase-resolvase